MKLDFRNDTSMLLTEIGRLLGLAPVLCMVGAVIMLIVAVFSVQDFVQALNEERRSLELPQFSLKSQPVGKVIYEDYALTLGRLSPDVRVVGEKDGLRISISDASKYAEFMYVLNSIQGVSKDVVWSASEICLATCAGGVSHAFVKGVVEKVEVKLRGQSNG